jgi:exonuclease SbcC
LDKLGYEPDENELRECKEKHRQIWDELSALEKEKVKKESIMHEKNKRIEEYERDLANLEEKKRESEALTEFLYFLEKVRRIFHKDYLQRDLRLKSKPLIERYAREIFGSFNLPYSDLMLTDDFNIVLYGPEGEESVEMLSGGERISSALALRMGIAKALSGPAMELIILDEPTIHLDAQRRQELVEIIKRLSSIPQTIVVTHDKEFEQAADRLISVEKVNGISRIYSSD